MKVRVGSMYHKVLAIKYPDTHSYLWSSAHTSFVLIKSHTLYPVQANGRGVFAKPTLKIEKREKNINCIEKLISYNFVMFSTSFSPGWLRRTFGVSCWGLPRWPRALVPGWYHKLWIWLCSSRKSGNLRTRRQLSAVDWKCSWECIGLNINEGSLKIIVHYNLVTHRKKNYT